MAKFTQPETGRAEIRMQSIWLQPCSSQAHKSETQRKAERYKDHNWGEEEKRDKERNRNGQRKTARKGNEWEQGGPGRLKLSSFSPLSQDHSSVVQVLHSVGIAAPGMGPPNLEVDLTP